jgi:hypothetical protein
VGGAVGKGNNEGGTGFFAEERYALSSLCPSYLLKLLQVLAPSSCPPNTIPIPITGMSSSAEVFLGSAVTDAMPCNSRYWVKVEW